MTLSGRYKKLLGLENPRTVSLTESAEISLYIMSWHKKFKGRLIKSVGKEKKDSTRFYLHSIALL